MKISFRLVQFDSYGAKSSCTFVETRDVKVLIDPGVSIMHPTFPANLEDKMKWVEEGRNRIKSAIRDVDIVFITHYHWDHYLREEINLYEGKIIFAKNPNEYINISQRKRAVRFYEMLYNRVLGEEYDIYSSHKNGKEFKDLAEELRSINIDYGEYNNRRIELLKRGRIWFDKLKEKWGEWPSISEIITKKLIVMFPENKTFRFGDTVIRVTNPLFHGIEYSRVGWVFSVMIEYNNYKLLYSSDLNGPIIEDYADIIIKENPNIIVLDGPMTYMLGYMLNLTNLRRVILNMKRIIENTDFDILIWDHHLPREKKFRVRTKDVWMMAEKYKKDIYTAREYEFGKKPIIEEL
jgi:hypothetical protein